MDGTALRLWHIFLLCALIQGLPACEKTAVRKEVSYSPEDTQVEIGRDVEILYSDSALVRVRVTAPTLYNHVDRLEPRQEFPDGIKVEFLNARLLVRSTLTARYAVRQQDKEVVVARDSVVLTTIENEILETEELIWNEKTGTLSTEKFVKITKPDEVIYGFGLEANQDFTYWKITVPKGIIKAEQLDEAAQ